MKEFFFRIKDELFARPAVAAVDVVLYAFLLYALFVFLKKHNAKKLIKYVVAFLTVSVILGSALLDFPLLGKIFDYGFIIVLVAVLLLFPQEVRKGLWRLSSPREMAESFNTKYECSDEELHEAVDDIVRAALTMAKKDVGALIVIAPENVPSHILESGTRMDAVISCGLLESVFITKGPLHDGAVMIRGNRIMAAGCFLPLTQSLEVDKELGTRHRAALGVSETHNVLTIIVSEETGIISVAYGGELKRYYDAAMLTETLEQVYGLRSSNGSIGKKRKRRKS